MKRLAVYRALYGFVVFVPFCWLWGIDNFTWFSLAGTLYFVPMHYVFDKIFKVKT